LPTKPKRLTEEEKAKIYDAVFQAMHFFVPVPTNPVIIISEGNDAKPWRWIARGWSSQESCDEGDAPDGECTIRANDKKVSVKTHV
jgi:hypothetical protein